MGPGESSLFIVKAGRPEIEACALESVAVPAEPYELSIVLENLGQKVSVSLQTVCISSND